MNGDLHDYQKLFDAISAMVFVITRDGKILAVNDAVTSKLGYARNELIGQSVLSIHPVGMEKEVCEVLEALSSADESLCTLALVKKNGKFVDVETRIYKGSWEGMDVLFGFSVDVTRQKATERKFQAIFTFSPIPIMVSTLDAGRIIDVNEAWCKLFNFSRDDVINRTTVDLNVWANNDERYNLVEAMTHTPCITGYPVHLLSSSGDSIYGLLSASGMTIEDESVWVTSFVDHTEQRLLEQQLDEIREITLTSALEQLDKQLSTNQYIRG